MNIALWLLDPDYDGRSLYPRQVFFVLSPGKDQLQRLAKTLKAEIDAELIESYYGTQSLPFEAGPNKRIAVKIRLITARLDSPSCATRPRRSTSTPRCSIRPRRWTTP